MGPGSFHLFFYLDRRPSRKKSTLPKGLRLQSLLRVKQPRLMRPCRQGERDVFIAWWRFMGLLLWQERMDGQPPEETDPRMRKQQHLGLNYRQLSTWGNCDSWPCFVNTRQIYKSFDKTLGMNQDGCSVQYPFLRFPPVTFVMFTPSCCVIILTCRGCWSSSNWGMSVWAMVHRKGYQACHRCHMVEPWPGVPSAVKEHAGLEAWVDDYKKNDLLKWWISGLLC